MKMQKRMKGVDSMSNAKKHPDVENMNEQQWRPAGCFSSWLRRTRSGLIKENGAVVDCGDCKACCTSSYFIHIRPEEVQTRSRINKKLLFPAPGLPKGNVLLGFFENGYCPMMVDDRCSIYEDRPITCRTYDCRIFTAAGIDAGDEDKALINQQARSWKFSYPSQRDRDMHASVKAAAQFLREHADCFPAGTVPNNPSQLAILAIKVYKVFLKGIDRPDKTGDESSNKATANAIIEILERFEVRRKAFVK